MIVRDEVIKAGSQALLRDGLDAMADMGAKALSARVVDAVEPLIRANEQGLHRREMDRTVGRITGTYEGKFLYLRTQVEALRKGYDSENSQDAIDDVLALLDEVTR